VGSRSVNEDEEHVIQDIYYLENIEQLEAISDPIRYNMYFLMDEPKTGAQLARELKISRARGHYHLNILKDVGLVTFCEEKVSSHGMTEKYYQGIAEYLDFSRLLPSDQQGLVPNEVTLRSFKAATRFIANLLDKSREGIAHLKVHESLGMGYHYILNSRLTPDQFRCVKEQLVALKDRIIEMERENRQADGSLRLVNCRTTFLLTPVSNGSLGAEPEEEEG